jgi:hypothetical protein
MKERRKRVARPLRLTLFGIFFLSIPIINYIGLAIRNRIPLYEFRLIVDEFRIFEIVLICIPVFVGIGLLLVQKWGWWLFLFYSLILVFYNTFILFVEFQPYNINSFFQTLLVFSALYYFLKKDVSAPFLFRPVEFGLAAGFQKKLNLLFSITDGFRKNKRRAIKIDVFIDSLKIKTIDLSVGGLYGTTTQFPFLINDGVKLKLTLNKTDFNLEAGIVRIDEIIDYHKKETEAATVNFKVGLAFRNINTEVKNQIEQEIKIILKEKK